MNEQVCVNDMMQVTEVKSYQCPYHNLGGAMKYTKCLFWSKQAFFLTLDRVEMVKRSSKDMS